MGFIAFITLMLDKSPPKMEAMLTGAYSLNSNKQKECVRCTGSAEICIHVKFSKFKDVRCQ